jgi:intracellular sulfur oxidation DsrE/DsrF family protein
MKKINCLFLSLIITSACCYSQSADYKVVFDLTTKDTNVHKSVLRWCTLILNSNPDAKLEVVFYGQSLDLVVKGKSADSDKIIQLAAGKNVSFRVCEAAMKHHNIDKSQLLPGVGTVPDGIYEIYLKQKEGYGYIKAGL